MKEQNKKYQSYTDYLAGNLSEVDPGVERIINLEEKRQAEKIILIPSESICPKPVRAALATSFMNLYGEGHPSRRMSEENDEELLLDVDYQLAYYRRYSNRRFYKGTEFVDFVESLAQRRIARCFATEHITADNIFVNVQPLSGAAANNSVYAAFLKPGDTIMGMRLSHGGHLSHGSEFNRSGKYYNVVVYETDPSTGKLDYAKINELARRYQPKMIIVGYSAYPWIIDWVKFRQIADEVGALLFADIAHVAGMIVAGVYPNPIGIADAITFTTHKTLCGPRGAAILTTDRKKAKLIDDAVFPGEQGGPHINKMVAIATTFKIAQTDAFKKLQRKIVENARILAAELAEKGLKIAYGGTDTHLLLIDLRAVETKTGFPLKGEIAARILDICGIVVNKNAIPEDEGSTDASGIRLGTPWVTQCGFGKAEIEKVAELIHRVLVNIRPFSYTGIRGELPRGKIDIDIIESVRNEVEKLVNRAKSSSEPENEPQKSWDEVHAEVHNDMGLLRITGEKAMPFLQEVSTANISELKPGDTISSFLLDAEGKLIDSISIIALLPDAKRGDSYLVKTTFSKTHQVKTWLEGLSDGYITFDPVDIFAKIQGPVMLEDVTQNKENILQDLQDSMSISLDKFKQKLCLDKVSEADGLSLYTSLPTSFDLSKPYFIGQKLFIRKGKPLNCKKEAFNYAENKVETKKSFLYDEQVKLGAKFTLFAGWKNPLYYTSILEEHRAVREAAGLFDISHMGILEIRGKGAADFLDVATTNYVRWLKPGDSQYSFLLDLDANVIDDAMVYARGKEKYMVVCNASNQEKVLTWLQAINSGKYVIDRSYPIREVKLLVDIENLKDVTVGKEQKAGIALQGPKSALILQKIVNSQKLKDAIARLEKNKFIECKLAGNDMLISRVGYTGEEIGFELYFHPEAASLIWGVMLENGREYAVKPCGLGARDSLRVEAGLPLHGHEVAGKYKIDLIEAGYGHFVKFHKPFFIGREILMQKERKQEKKIVRFRLQSKQVKMLREGDPVVNERGMYVGRVTSCALAGEFQFGLAYVDKKIKQGDDIAIFPLSGGRQEGKSAEKLCEGDRITLPLRAKVLPRFLKEDKAWKTGSIIYNKAAFNILQGEQDAP